MKYLVHQTLLIEADTPEQAGQMAVEIQQSRRDWPYCNQFTVHGAEGDAMIAKQVFVAVATQQDDDVPKPVPPAPQEVYSDPESWAEQEYC